MSPIAFSSRRNSTIFVMCPFITARAIALAAPSLNRFWFRKRVFTSGMGLHAAASFPLLSRRCGCRQGLVPRYQSTEKTGIRGKSNSAHASAAKAAPVQFEAVELAHPRCHSVAIMPMSPLRSFPNSTSFSMGMTFNLMQSASRPQSSQLRPESLQSSVTLMSPPPSVWCSSSSAGLPLRCGQRGVAGAVLQTV